MTGAGLYMAWMLTKLGIVDVQNGVLCDDFLLEMESILNIKR